MVWQKKDKPKYHVISLRVNDEELEAIRKATGGSTRQKFLHAAVLFALELRNAKTTVTRRVIGR
jgi:hypothetical protein